MHLYRLYAYVLPVSSYTLSSVEWFTVCGCMWIVAGFGNGTFDRDDPSLLCAERKERFVLGARGGHVACAMEM